MTRRRSAAMVAALAVGTVCVAEGSWIHVKAWLAQALIASAWSHELGGGGVARPWPWADTHPVARVTFASGARAEDWMVLEGASGRNLAFGPVHDPSSVLPGEIGNSVIEGHRDTQFALLREVRRGDSLVVQTRARRRVRFVVTDLQVIDSRVARVLLDAQHPRLTLVTCYPFDAIVPGGPLRYAVTADAE